MRRIVSIGVTALLAVVLAASSGMPHSWYPPDSAELRLAWSARPERIETCRRLSDAELEARPAHMRQRVECEGRSATYLLTVTVDGVVIDSVVVMGAGLRHDRPIILLRGYEVRPGARAVRVAFARREAVETNDSVVDSTPANAREAREALQRRGRRQAALPALLSLDRTIDFRDGEAVLITVDAGRLALRTP